MKTKDKLIEIGYDLMKKKGYNNTSVNCILENAKIPKGSFYHHFKNKNDFVGQILENHINMLENEYNKISKLSKFTVIEKIRKIFDFNINYYVSDKSGSAVQNFLDEIALADETFRLRIIQHNQKFKEIISGLIQDGKNRFEITNNIETNLLVERIFNSWNGALSYMKIRKSYSPMASFFQFVFYYLLK